MQAVHRALGILDDGDAADLGDRRYGQTRLGAEPKGFGQCDVHVPDITWGNAE